MSRANNPAILREERDGWIRRADKAEAEVVRLRARVAELEAAEQFRKQIREVKLGAANA